MNIEKSTNKFQKDSPNKMAKYLDEILKKYNLELIEIVRTPDNSGIKSSVVVAKGDNNVKYGIKLFDSKDNYAKERFIDEIGYIKYLKGELSSKYKKWIPRIRWHSTKGENPYYIYVYIEGEPLGKFIEDFGIKWGYFKHKNFSEFIDFFGVLEDLIEKDVVPAPRNWGYRTARKELQSYFENVKGLLPSEMYDKIMSFNDKYGDKAFRTKALSHRDLYPENILISGKGSTNFTFLDWEYLSEVPIGFNAAFLYLLFWREEYWKAKVFSYYYRKYDSLGDFKLLSNFMVSFRFCLISLGVRFMYQLEAFGDKSSSDFEHARLSFISDIDRALSGEIASPRNIKFFIDINDIKEVAKRYGIKDIKDYEIFYASKGNTVVKVDVEKESLIFRFYSQSRSKSLINRELKIFETLYNCGIKTYKVVKSSSDELYIEHKLYGKVRKIAVLKYIKGSKIKARWANEKASRDLGLTLRKIHEVNIIHGDFSKENVLFIKSKVSGVIDFEWGRITKSRKAKFYDMAKAIALWLIDVRNKNIADKEFIREFLIGYYGFMPSNKQVKKIAMAVGIKIDDERSIFMTTIDKRERLSKRLGSRFDRAINAMNGLAEV